MGLVYVLRYQMRKSSYDSPEIELGTNVVVIPYRMLYGWRVIFSRTKITFQVNFQINALTLRFHFSKSNRRRKCRHYKTKFAHISLVAHSKLKSSHSRIAAIKCKLSVQLHSKIDRISFEWLKAKTRLRLRYIWHRLPCKRNFPIHFRFLSNLSALFSVRKEKIYAGELNKKPAKIFITFLQTLLL